MGVTMSTILPGAKPPKIREVDAKKGHYKVGSELWKVGSRYKILEFLGGGAYGQVCKAQDKQTRDFVAVKMVKDVMQSESVLKRTLREVYIMRRLSHPNILSLLDVFLSSSEDKMDTTDLYIVSEFADRGSVMDLQGPLYRADVKNLMRQILQGLKYMHLCKVWHSDIQSGIILFLSPMIVKICDFNVSRPMEEVTSNVNNETRSTSTYCAPEVILSHQNYGSAIDIWGIGCIFWKLLKLSSPGKFRIQHLFQHQKQTKYKYPKTFEKLLTEPELKQLQKLCDIFSIIGTPCWKDIDSCIPCPNWRSYLKQLSGKNGDLESTLGEVDNEALDLLSRMLAFNPSRRCTAEEALSHQYFQKPASREVLIQRGYQSASVSKNNTPHFALQQIDELIQNSMSSENSEQILMDLLRKEIDNHHFKNMDLTRKENDNRVVKYRSLIPSEGVKTPFIPRRRALEDEENVKSPKQRKKSFLERIQNVFS